MTFVRFYDLATELDRLFDDALTVQSCPRAGARREAEVYTVQASSRLDLYESKDSDAVTAVFDFPGLTSDDIAIDVHQSKNQLTVFGKFASSNTGEEKEYVVHERRSGKFSRTLQLPIGTQAEDVKAKMENGVLTITFPKTTPGQEAKRVIIQ